MDQIKGSKSQTRKPVEFTILKIHLEILVGSRKNCCQELNCKRLLNISI